MLDHLLELLPSEEVLFPFGRTFLLANFGMMLLDPVSFHRPGSSGGNMSEMSLLSMVTLPDWLAVNVLKTVPLLFLNWSLPSLIPTWAAVSVVLPDWLAVNFPLPGNVSVPSPTPIPERVRATSSLVAWLAVNV